MEINNTQKIDAFRALFDKQNVASLIKEYEKLEGLDINNSKKKEYFKQIHELAGNEHLKKLIENLLIIELRDGALNSRSWEEVLVNRGTVAGIKLLWETIGQMSTEYENLGKTDLPTEEEARENY